MKNIIIVIILFFGFAGTGMTQNKEQNLILFAKYTEDGVRLKVAPQTAAVWLKGAEAGYNYYRREIGQTAYVKINKQVVKPLSPAEITRLFGADSDSLIAFQQSSVTDQIQEGKIKRNPFDAVSYREELDKNYGFYFLLSTRLPEISVMSGLEMTDKEAVAGKAYEYKVEIAGGDPAQDASTTEVFTDSQDIMLPVVQAYEGDKVINLQWEQSENTAVLSYFIEKSGDESKFVRLNKAPIYLNLTDEADSLNTDGKRWIFYTDSLNENYVPYTYRLVGLDVWGEETNASIPMTYMGRDRTAPELPDSLWVEAKEETQSLIFHWTWDKQPEDLDGMLVFHADSSNGHYLPLSEELIDPSVSKAMLDSVVPGRNHYFQLVVTDTAGNFQASRVKYGYLPDIYPPAAPAGVTAIVDSSGVVSIEWMPNSEDDLKGYAVYRSNGTKLRFIKVSGYPVESTRYQDTLSLHRLNKHTFYTLMAMDNSFNFSEYSDTIAVQIPDTIAPVPGNLISVEMKADKLTFNLVPSASSDVAEQVLVQCDDQGVVINEIASLLPSDTAYATGWTEEGVFYFAMKAIDQDHNESELSPLYSFVQAKIVQDPVVQNLKLRKKKSGIELKWDYSGPGKYYYRIYRVNEKNKSKYLGQTGEFFYTDVSADLTGKYSYYVCMVTSDGLVSIPSDKVSVKL